MKELWDLYDENRKKLDKKVYRGEKLEDGEYHLVVNAWIRNCEGKYLMSKRSAKKNHPFLWECTGGSVIKGEDTINGAYREVKEELGIDITSSDRVLIGTTKRYYLNNNDILDVYLFFYNINIEDIKFTDGEVMDVKWMSKEEKIRFTINYK